MKNAILTLLATLTLLLNSAVGNASEIEISRSRYKDQLHGFWLGQCIANWTGLVTEMDKVKAPFYTDEDWGKPDQPNMWGDLTKHSQTISFYFVPKGKAWGADDDTDIEYMYQHLIETSDSTILTGGQIREGWLKHIYSNEDAPIIPGRGTTTYRENFLWVSNETAYYLMKDKGLVPPQTSEPKNNPDFDMIDAQLTTEIFGLYAPTRPDIALKMAHLPIRTTAKNEAEWISKFYVTMYALASSVDKGLSPKDKIFWMADQASQQLPKNSYPKKMYDFVLAAYQANPDKDNWEKTRDQVYERYQVGKNDGYVYKKPFDAGINFASSLVSLFYGEGDISRTIRIGTLTGWDSDNPTATWGGMLGFMLGKNGVEKAFGKSNLPGIYSIHRTRRNFADRTPKLAGEDTFTMMSERGMRIVDRVVVDLMQGRVDGKTNTWHIPAPAAK